MDLLKALGAVVVVGVDHGEGTVHHLAGGQDGVGGAPGLYALLGDGVALGQIVQLLIGILHVDDLAQTVADSGLEGILDLMLDDEDHGLKAGAAGVVDGVVNDELIVVANRVHLLKSAVAAAHTGGHNYKNRFFHTIHSFLSRPLGAVRPEVGDRLRPVGVT